MVYEFYVTFCGNSVKNLSRKGRLLFLERIININPNHVSISSLNERSADNGSFKKLQPFA